MNFKDLSIEEKFGQMILLGLDTYEINEEIIDIIKTYKIGGVVLYKKNYTSLSNMVEVINKLKTSNEGNGNYFYKFRFHFSDKQPQLIFFQIVIH